MKAHVFVTLKSGVLDPQGKAIHHSVEQLGHRNLADIRQGKYFELTFADDVDGVTARTTAETIANNVLANPVIEDYRVEIAE